MILRLLGLGHESARCNIAINANLPRLPGLSRGRSRFPRQWGMAEYAASARRTVSVVSSVHLRGWSQRWAATVDTLRLSGTWARSARRPSP